MVSFHERVDSGDAEKPGTPTNRDIPGIVDSRGTGALRGGINMIFYGFL
jgi:hypothetical protein